MSMRKVVITGMGAISPFGIGMVPLMEGLQSGSSAVISQKEAWETKITDLNCWVGAPLKEELPAKTIPRKYRRTMDRLAIMGMLATEEALEEAKLPEHYFTTGQMGVSFSSTMGSANSLTNFFSEYLKSSSLKEVSAGTFFRVMSHTCAANIAHALGICGRVISPDAACSSSAQAIGLAYEMIKNGQQDIMLCGGSDELDAVVCGTFDLLNATSYQFNDRPTQTPRPFDSARDGTVCGEGAGCIVLESEESALQRGATILAEVAGFATSADGTHLAQPHSESIVRCLQKALKDSNVKAQDVDYVNAHATATILGDIAEAEALSEVFGPKKVLVSSLKGHIGHTMGASGVIELAASIKMMQNGVLIPTLNLESPGEGCDKIEHLDKNTKKEINIFIKNSFAFGGINVVLIIRRYEDK